MADSLIERTASAYSFPLLIRHLLRTPLATVPDREIVYATHRRYTYTDFAARVSRLAGALRDLGVAHGDTVAVMDWDSHRYLECFFAVPMLGAVLHTINVRLPPEQIVYTINHAEDDVLLVHRDFLPLLAEIAPRLERPLRFVLLQDAAGETPDSMHGEYEALLAAAAPRFEFRDFDENTRATTFYTTGTTGLPKAVYYSHRQIVLHTLASMATTGVVSGHGRFHRDDVYMPITPMFHVHAWGQPFVATLMGVKQVYPGRYSPEGLLGLIRDEGVTFSHCVPTILQMLLDAPQAADTDLSRWKVVVGGSALPRGLARKATALGIDVYSGYGMSETGPVLTMAHLDDGMLAGDIEQQIDVRIRTGRPLPLVDLRVVDEAMRDADEGEVVVRAPWLTQGYFKDTERSEALWSGGYLHTGDIGRLDAQGYLRVSDRLKDVIKSGGEWISSLQLEDLVSQLPGVGEAAAIGIADATWGERPLMLIVPAPDVRALDEAAVKAHLQACADNGEINAWAVPERVLFVESLEKTSVGKLDKKRLREKYAREP